MPPLADCAPGRFFIRHCVDLVGDLDALCTLASTSMLDRVSTESTGKAGALPVVPHTEPDTLESPV